MSDTKQFIKNTEDFACEHCGFLMKGNGYTNHCSKCLWSKHVDVNPGDRLSACQGMMAPISIEGSTGESYRVVHKCQVCGYIKVNKIGKDDNIEAVLEIIRKKADAFQNRTR